MLYIIIRHNQSIYIVLILTNSLIPISDNSRPYPDLLIPPKGNLGSDLDISFINTDPAFIIPAYFSPLSGADVQILAQVDGDKPVAVREGKLLATAFHPELTSDTRVHKFFSDIASA